MKLLASNASHRGERGITARLLARLGEGAQQAGAGFETLTLRASQAVIPVPFFGLLKRPPWARRRVPQALNGPSSWE